MNKAYIENLLAMPQPKPLQEKIKTNIKTLFAREEKDWNQNYPDKQFKPFDPKRYAEQNNQKTK